MIGRREETELTFAWALRSGPSQFRLDPVRKPKKLWKVGDLIRHTGMSRQTIHNYCVLGLIAEAERTPSGHRLYDDSVFTRLERIARLKRQGKRLQEIAALLSRKRGSKKRTKGTSGAKK